MISGIVAVLSRDDALARAARDAIGQQPALEMGPADKQRLPLVLEAATPTESQIITDWLNSLPGVEHIDVAYVHLDETIVEQRLAESQPLCNKSELRN